MYRRFLNNDDYLGVVTADALSQMTRGNDDRFIQAEESAEMSLIEYLSENYEVEQELNKGKYIAGYDRKITYPVGVHIYHEGRICEVIRAISGYKAPASFEYWEEYTGQEIDNIKPYSQFETYYKGDFVVCNETAYTCLHENGYKFYDIRIPMVVGWLEAFYEEWQPIEYNLWDIVLFERGFYTLMSLEGFDNNQTPLESANWGAVADYDPEYNKYELNGHEYVVKNNKVFYPELDPNADMPEIGRNLSPNDLSLIHI